MTDTTADLADALGPDAKVLDGPLRRFTAVEAFSGPALLVRLFETDGFLKRTLAEPGQGRVAVVSVDSRRAPAVFGAGMARLAEENGWAGVVIDGRIRDVAAVRERRVGVIAAGTAPFISREGPPGRVVDEMEAFGVALRAGDRIVADLDGVVAIAPEVEAA